MNCSLRIAKFVGCFPVVSETFILRQITGLLDLGHDVQIYADSKADPDTPIHSEVASYRLLERTTYMGMPPETAPWEMPVWPISGRTWPPGSPVSVRNLARVGRAAPQFLRCLLTHPRLAVNVLNPTEYQHQAASLSALHRLAALVSVTQKPDVLHAHFGPLGNSFRFARQLWQAPLVVSFHGYDFSTVPRQSGAKVYDRLFQTLDAALVNSDYMKTRLEEMGCPASRIHKLPYGVNLADFSACERGPESGLPVRILTIGRLVEKKGLEHSIRAFARVRAVHSSVSYDIVGEGPLRKILQKLIEQLGVDKSVTLHGALEGREVRQMLAKAHLFVLASVTAADGDQEGTPVSLMEAQASGLPVLSTRHSGIPEIVREGETGFLLPEGDVSALAERLNYLIEHPAARQEMGQRGRQHIATHFSHQQLIQQLMELYLEVRRNWKLDGTRR